MTQASIRTYDLRGYMRRLSVVQFILGLVVLWILSSAFFYWVSRDGLASPRMTYLSTLLLGYFWGVVTCYSAIVQPRKQWLMGRMAIRPEEENELRQLLESPRVKYGWLCSLVAMILMIGLLSIVHFTFNVLFGSFGIGRRMFQVQSGVFPAVFSAIMVRSIAYTSLISFVIDKQHNVSPRRASWWKILWKNYLLPAVLLNTTLGVFLGGIRFYHAWPTGEVSHQSLASHLLVSGMLLSLLITMASQMRARVDFLGPVEIRMPSIVRWKMGSVWLGVFVFPLGISIVIGTLPLWTESNPFGFGEVLWIKGAFCFVLAGFFSVATFLATWKRLQQGGVLAHPYMRISRFIKDHKQNSPSNRMPRP